MDKVEIKKENQERNDKKFIWFRVHWIGRCLTYFVVGIALACAIVFPILGNRSSGSNNKGNTIDNMTYISECLFISVNDEVKAGNTYTLKFNVKDSIDYYKEEGELEEGQMAFLFSTFKMSEQSFDDLEDYKETNYTFEYFEQDSFTVKYGSKQLNYLKDAKDPTEEQLKSAFSTKISDNKQIVEWRFYSNEDNNYNIEITMKCKKSGNISMKLALTGA